MTAVCPSAPPSSVATPARRDGSSRAASAGRRGFGDQDCAFGEAGKTAERGAHQIADQSARDFLYLVGAAAQAGLIVRWHGRFGLGQDGVDDSLGFFGDGALGREEEFLNSLSCATDQP